jgi:Ca2+-binding RTX toxin-like protein
MVLPTGTAALSWSAPGAACYRVLLDGTPEAFAATICANYPGGNGSLYIDETNLADGPHTLRVQAETTGGGKGPVGQVTFTVETKDPQTTITAKPPALSKSDTATFEFTADEPATFECNIDSGGWSSCESPLNLTDLEDADHTFEVRATDDFDNVEDPPASWSWKVDTVAPVVIDLDGPPSVTSDDTAVLTFAANEPAATFECRLNESEWAACVSGVTYPDLADGSYTFEVRAKDLAGNESAVETHSWVLGTDPPETVIDSGPDELVKTTDATIAFSSPDAGVTFECRLDSSDPEDFAPCTSPETLSGLSEGAHTFAVRAVTSGGLADPTPASVTWTVDLTAPTVTIDSGPSGTVGPGPVTFTFSPSEEADLYCSLDGSAAELCISPLYLGVLTGTSHVFSVHAVDRAGNPGPTATQEWTVDDVAPVVTITSKPPGYSKSRDATVEYSVDDPTASVKCSIDAQAFESCGPTPGEVTLTGLSDGLHTVSVQATDPVGNQNIPPAVASWRVDTIDPVVTITGGTPQHTSSTTGEVTFTVEDASPTTTECRVDGTGDDPWTPCSSGQTFPGLGEGLRTIEVRATDAATNKSPAVNRKFTVDTTAPVVTITDAPTGTVSDPDAEISFVVTDANETTTTCSLDGGALEDCTSPKAYPGLDNGSHTVTVRAKDAAGNEGEATTSWTVETLEPDTFVDSAPPAQSSSADNTIAFSSDNEEATFECSLDEGGTWTDCVSPLVLTDQPDADYELFVRAVFGGLTDPTPAKATWTVDTIAPVLVLTSAPSGTTTAEDSVFEFTVDDPDATTSCRLDSDDENDWSPCASGFTPTVGDGKHTLEIRAKDLAGNVSNIESTTWTVDSTIPVVDITSGPSGDISVRDVEYSFTVVDTGGLEAVECRLRSLTTASITLITDCTSPVGFEDLEDDRYRFEVVATDRAGLEGSDSAEFVVDATGPTVEITDGPSGTTTSTDATIRFTVDDPDATLECLLDSAPWAPCAPEEDLVLSGLNDGSHTFEVRARDGLDNEGSDSRSWTVDTAEPTVTITSGPDGEINIDDAAFGFTADEPVDFECRLDSTDVDGTWEACGSGLSSSFEYEDLAVDDYVFRVRGTDAAGLSDETSRGFSVRILGDPEVTVGVTAVTPAGIPLASTGLGDDFSYRVTLTNNGVATAQDLSVEVPLSSDVALRGALPTGCTSPDADGPVTCTRAALAVDATITIDLPVEAIFDCDVWGDSGNNTLNGTTSGETICGGGGGDIIQGRGGNDVVFGYGPRSIGGGTLSVSTGAGVNYGPGDLSGTSGIDAVVTIAGTDGADNITTATGDDRIDGEEGNDFVVAGGGTDTIDGGDGGDVIQTGSGGGNVDAGPGNDTVFGGSGDDIVQGGSGNDWLAGDSGNDQLHGGDGDDTLYGQSGDDSLLSGGGNDFADGGDGTDSVYGGDGNDTVRGGNGSDAAVNGQDGRDFVYGDDGNDAVVAGGEGNDYLVDGGNGDDRVFGNDGNDGDVQGGFGNDEVHGGNGNDIVRGGFGNDRVDGDGGNDYLYGEFGNDELNGDAGDDYLNGGWDNDELNGGDGNDDLYGEFGNDELNGGDGNDDLFGEWGDDNLNGDTGDDRLYGGWGRDILRGYAGNDRLLGGYDHDYLDGNAGDDYLNGQEGRDVLRGNAGNDELDGGPAWGPAWLDAYDHWNRLYGDAGTDICRFGPGLNFDMTNYRHASCELRTPTTGPAGQGWLNGARARLDRGASNPAEYPG